MWKSLLRLVRQARPPVVARYALALVAVCAASAASAQALRPAPPLKLTPAEEVTALLKDKAWDKALARAEAILVKNPRDVQVRFLRTVTLGEMGRTADATAALEAMTQDFPELPEPHNNLGVILASQGRYEPARAALQRALAAAPDYVTAHENLGDLYLAMAADAYQRAATLAPGAAPIQAKLKFARELVARVPSIK